MYLADVLDPNELQRLINEKYINQVVSPDGRHVLYNYTEKAQYDRKWTRETLQ